MYVLLDSGAQSSVVNTDAYLTNVRQSDVTLSILGVSEGRPPTTKLIGELDPFGTVYYCKDIRVNVLSMAEQRDRAVSLRYDYHSDCYNLECKDGSVQCFTRKDNLYGKLITNDFDCENNNVAAITVRDREKQYTKHEIKRAKEVMRVSRCLGYEGMQGLSHVIRTGAFNNLGITHQDVARAFDIYGPSVPFLKGTSTRRKIFAMMPIVEVERPILVVQSLYLDIMTIEGVNFMVAVSKPMNLTTVEELVKTDSHFISKVLNNIINTYRSFSYDVGLMVSDADSKLIAALSRIPDVKYSPVGSGVHVKIIESDSKNQRED